MARLFGTAKIDFDTALEEIARAPSDARHLKDQLYMTKNERLMMLSLTKVSGRLLQAVSTMVKERQPSDSTTFAIENLEEATKSFEKLVQLMAEEWDQDD